MNWLEWKEAQQLSLSCFFLLLLLRYVYMCVREPYVSSAYYYNRDLVFLLGPGRANAGGGLSSPPCYQDGRKGM